jgi:formylglycine-generating enzyme
MTTEAHLQLAEVQQRVCDITSEQLGIARNTISPRDRLIEDLRCDSLDLVELFMELEEAFRVTLPSDPPNSAYKAVFTRQPFRLSDIAELVYLQQGTGTPQRKRWRRAVPERPLAASVPFTQLSGRWEGLSTGGVGLFERIDSDQSFPQYRRRSDGMRCVLVPSNG